MPLQKLNRQLVAALEASPVATMIHDLDDKVMFLNTTAERLFGWQAQIAIGKFPAFVPESEREKFSRMTRQVRSTGRGEFRDTWRVRADGSPIDVRVNCTLLHDDASQPYAILRYISDLSLIKKLEAEVSAQEIRYRKIVEHPRDAYVEMDHAGYVTEWNSRAEQLFGWKKAEAIGAQLAELIIPPTLRAQHWRGLKRFLETGRGQITDKKVQVDALRKDGALIPLELLVNASGTSGAPRFYAFLHDVREQRLKQSDLRVTLYDPLTELPNRQLFSERIEALLAAADVRADSAAVLMVDINRFNAINEVHGQRLGDRVLKSVSDLLKASVRETDTVARLANDDFGVILTHVDNGSVNIPSIVKAAYDKLCQPFSINGKSIHLSVAVGAAIYSSSVGSTAEFLRQANQALLEAKSERCGYKIVSGASETLRQGDLR